MLARKLVLFAIGALMLIPAFTLAAGDGRSFLEQHRTVYVDKVWTGAMTMCPMLTRDGMQYVAYYDANGQMTVAGRRLESDKWTYKKLDDKIMWDSHNYISMGMDSEGYLHVSGNMHGAHLRYYRSAKPGDVSSLVGVHKMVGSQEKSVTYPRFFNGVSGELFFMYRDGSSGQGNTLIDRYDPKTRTWSRIGDKPILDGEGLMNAYNCLPKHDSRGVYHLAWVWRDTGDAVTNHDLSYARTVGSDLASWCTSGRKPLPLPITLSTGEIIDPLPIRSGLRNNMQLSFDAQDRPMVTYVEYNPKPTSVTQIYVMRLEASGWKRYQTTNWTDTDEYSGGGTIGAKIRFAGPAPFGGSKTLYQTFVNEFAGPYIQIRFLDGQTLKPVGEPMRLYPADLDKLPKDQAQDWTVNWGGGGLDNWANLDMDALHKQGSVWVMRWTTMRPNRDQPRATVPPPSRLEVIEFRERRDRK